METKQPQIIKYASLEALECPKCGQHEAVVYQVKARFRKMRMSKASLDIADFIRPEFKEAYKAEYAKYGVEIGDDELEKQLDGDLPLARLKCQNCGYKWNPEVDTAEAYPEDRLDQMGFITIERQKRFFSCAVSVLVLINGVLYPLNLGNGDIGIFPTMVKHNRVQFLFNQVATLGTHTNTMRIVKDVEVNNGENVNISMKAQWIML